MTLSDWKSERGISWPHISRQLWDDYGVSVSDEHLRKLGSGAGGDPAASTVLSIVMLTDGEVTVSDLIPEHGKLKEKLSEVLSLKVKKPR